jgi:hypothetical protein
MNPHLTEALAQQRIADWHREAAARRLAAAALRVDGPAARPRSGRVARLLRTLGRRRYRQIELVWPDGVCSVVSARPDDAARPMAGSRR